MSSFKFVWDFKSVVTSREWHMLTNKSPNSFRFSKFSRTLSIFMSPLSSFPFHKVYFKLWSLSSSLLFHHWILRRPNLPFQVENRIYQVGSIWTYCFHLLLIITHKNHLSFFFQLLFLLLRLAQYLCAEGAASLFVNCFRLSSPM